LISSFLGHDTFGLRLFPKSTFCQKPGKIISAVVFIDSVILPNPGFVEALRPFAEALCGEGYREALEETVSSLFLTTDDSTRKSRLLSAMANVPQISVMMRWNTKNCELFNRIATVLAVDMHGTHRCEFRAKRDA